jgi:hypothetical protein
MFWAYENWRAHGRATIHLEHCGHCNGGLGKHSSASNQNGKWLHFQNREEVREYFLERSIEVRSCGSCSPILTEP